MYHLYRVNTRIRFVKSFATYSELYAYCKVRGWLSKILPDGTITPDPVWGTESIMEYPDGFQCEVWEDEEEG